MSVEQILSLPDKQFGALVTKLRPNSDVLDDLMWRVTEHALPAINDDGSIDYGALGTIQVQEQTMHAIESILNGEMPR
jgi:hypothetical protein